MSAVEVVEWTPRWAEQFAEVAAALREALRDVRSDAGLRDAYAEVKQALAADPHMAIDTYIAGKSAVLQQVLEVSGEFTADELAAIHRLNESVAKR